MSKADVSIGGRRYTLNCEEGEETRVLELGERFEARVTELRDALGDIGHERLFLAAGLSLLHELESVSAGRGDSSVDDRVQGLERRAAAALNRAADRILSLSRRIDEAG